MGSRQPRYTLEGLCDFSLRLKFKTFVSAPPPKKKISVVIAVKIKAVANVASWTFWLKANLKCLQCFSDSKMYSCCGTFAHPLPTEWYREIWWCMRTKVPNTYSVRRGDAGCRYQFRSGLFSPPGCWKQARLAVCSPSVYHLFYTFFYDCC